MIFAAYDFVKYWFGKGIYSDEAIAMDGLVLASEQELPELDDIECGFMFFHRRRSFCSWLVMYYTGPTLLSHCAIITGGGVLYDMTIEGGMIHHVSDYFDGSTYIKVLSMPVSKEKLNRLILRDELRLGGVKFGWKKIFFFWVEIITGRNEDFRLRSCLDIVVVIVALMLLCNQFFALQLFFASCLLLYSATVVYNKVLWKAASPVETRDKERPSDKCGVSSEDELDNFYEVVVSSDEEDFHNTIEVWKQVYSDMPKVLVAFFSRTAYLLCRIIEFGRAEICYKEAIHICRTSDLHGSLMHASILNNYAGFLVKRKQRAPAKKVMLKGLEIIEDNAEDETERQRLLQQFSNNLEILED